MQRAFVVIVVLFILNIFGAFFHLYSTVWWWDILTHMLGGAVIGFLSFGIMDRIFRDRLSGQRFWGIWFCVLMCIFLGWELYEVLVSDILNGWAFNRVDTLHDIINDLLGGYISYRWTKEFL
jgi:hypothetical protein